MTLAQQSKVMIILWHWDDLKQKGILFDEIEVEGDEGHHIIRIEENEHRYSQEEKTNEIIQQVNLAVNKGSNIIVLLHTSSLDNAHCLDIQRVLKEKKESLNRENFILTLDYFGGGKSYIYYLPEDDTGLLNQQAGFAINEPYKVTNHNTGEVERKRVSVATSDNIKIQKKYFDPVWKYYSFRTKRMTFELKENLITYLVGKNSEIDPNLTLADFLSVNEPWLLAHLQEFCNEPINMEAHQNIYLPYKALTDFLNQTPVNGNSYLQDVRQKFIDLLNAMPEMIYGR